MPISNFQADPELAKNFLYNIIVGQASRESITWLESQIKSFQKTDDKQVLNKTFSQVPRLFKRVPLTLEESDLKKANILRQGFNPAAWTIDQAVRALVLLHIPHDDTTQYKQQLHSMFDIADVNELVALYSSLALLPYPEERRSLAVDGLRSSMTDIFDSVALNNPFPTDYLDEPAWNQMVLKAVFMNRPLSQVHKLESRVNEELGQKLIDYTNERQAAGRDVSNDLRNLLNLHLEKGYIGREVVLAPSRKV